MRLTQLKVHQKFMEKLISSVRSLLPLVLFN